jgi:hypothetical protein
MYGCLPMPTPYYSPSDIMRNIELKEGKWMVMIGEIGSGTQGAIGIKVISINTLILLKGKYYLLRETKAPILIAKDSVGKDIEDSVILKPLSMEEYSPGRKLVDFQNKTYSLYGYFFNLDKIFLENPWCNFIFIDDTYAGLLFNRQGQEHVESNYSLAKEFCSFTIVHECANYSLLKKYGEDTFNKQKNGSVTKSNTTK